MKKSKKKCTLFIVLLILLAAMLLFVGLYLGGLKKYYGMTKKTVAFTEFNSYQQAEINSCIFEITGSALEIQNIVLKKYKDGLVNYIIEFDESIKLDISAICFNEIYNFDGRSTDTGYYYEDNHLCFVIRKRDYSQFINDENGNKNNNILRNLDKLTEIISEHFSND